MPFRHPGREADESSTDKPRPVFHTGGDPSHDQVTVQHGSQQVWVPNVARVCA